MSSMSDDDEAPQLVDDHSAAASLAAALPPAKAAVAAAPASSPTPTPATAAAATVPYTRNPADPPVPLTILTGWLGAGKTTLLTRILAHFSSRGQSLAIIQNEASSFGVEAGMKVQNQATAGSAEASVFNDLLELSNGCVCCSVKSDFILGVETLLDRKRFDYIVLECSGLADPGPLVNTFWVDPELESSVYLDGVVSVVDAKNFLGHLRTNSSSERNNNEAEASLEAQQVIHQIAYADRVLLNKLDLVPDAEKDACLRQIALINQAAAVYTSTRSEVDLDLLLHIHAFDVRDTTRSLCMPPPLESDVAAAPSAAAAALSAHPHDRSISTLMLDDVSIPVAQRGVVDLDKLKQWLADLLWKDVKVTDGNKGEAQSFAATNANLGAGWTAAASAPAPESAAASSASSSASPPPSASASSSSSSSRPNSLFRVKAIMRVAGEEQPMFLQAVQELYDIQPGDEWPTTSIGKNGKASEVAAAAAPPSRFTRFVFIGRRLDRASLEAGFQSIFVRPS